MPVRAGRAIAHFARAGAVGLPFVLVQASGAGGPDLPQGEDRRLDPLLSFALPGAEIPAFDPVTGALFVTCIEGLARVGDPAGVGDVEILDLSPGLAGSITHVATDPAGRAVGVVTVAADDPASPGWVIFFSSRSGAPLARLEVGCHPDAAAFSPDGRWLVVANEGEPALGASGAPIDPPGSISIIDLSAHHSAWDFTQTPLRVETICFDDVVTTDSTTQPGAIRIHPRAWSQPHLDLEPEYVAVSDDAAWVTLQENNAIATLQLKPPHTLTVTPLGAWPQRLDGTADGRVSVTDRVLALPMPDQVATFTVGGRRYLVTADEGDTRGRVGRDGPLADVARIGELARAGRITHAAASILPDDLEVCAFTGDTDGDGVIDQPVVMGTRGISIWDASTMERVGHTGDAIEMEVSRVMPRRFNADGAAPRRFDARSDQRGPEPEGVIVAEVDGRPMVFVGLERPGAVAMIDVSTPAAPRVLQVIDTTLDDGRAPEGMLFLPARRSPFGCDLLVVAFEVSGRVGFYALR